LKIKFPGTGESYYHGKLPELNLTFKGHWKHCAGHWALTIPSSLTISHSLKAGTSSAQLPDSLVGWPLKSGIPKDSGRVIDFSGLKQSQTLW
jgi:hypothetical protein